MADSTSHSGSARTTDAPMVTSKRERAYPLQAAIACHFYGCPKEWVWIYLMRWASEGGKSSDFPVDHFGFRYSC